MKKRKRETVVELVRAGHGTKAIKDITGHTSSTVYEFVKAFKAYGDVSRKLHDRSGTRKRTPTFLAGLKRSVTANPGTRCQSWPKSATAVKELNIISYKRSQAHLLTGKMKEVRLKRCKKVLNSLKSGTFPPLKFFSDEKIFTLDRSSNLQNDRWLAKTKKEVPKSFRTKNPASVMVLGVVSTAGDAGEKISINVYLGVQKEVVKPWMDEKASGDVYNGRYLFQQDSTPPHKAKKTQEWFQANTWTFNSPDLWTTTTIGGVGEASIKRQASKLPATDVTAACKACKAFRSRHCC
ncbi:Transposable element tcb2 transposase [Caligus rogercresseyi]|uniref:Transposable element tcb2 transposase n=1 Tax=Caligus rogercresseyi TaxID=217165 RepID=A0A7T8KB32_CALRO|nr:Transposable element tcb2 transposase [Caligus rogercresseyi]